MGEFGSGVGLVITADFEGVEYHLQAFVEVVIGMKGGWLLLVFDLAFHLFRES